MDKGKKSSYLYKDANNTLIEIVHSRKAINWSSVAEILGNFVSAEECCKEKSLKKIKDIRI